MLAEKLVLAPGTVPTGCSRRRLLPKEPSTRAVTIFKEVQIIEPPKH